MASREILGEIVVVLAGAPAQTPLSDELIVVALNEHMAAGLSLRDAVNHVVEQLGVSHRETYARALRLRADEGA